MIEKLRAKCVIIIFITAVLCGVYAYFPALTDRYVISDDARILLYWMYQFQDPSLFPHDLLVTYSKDYTPWGYDFLFYICSKLGDPLLAGHTITIILLGVGAVYMFKLVREFAGEFAGIFSAVCFMFSSSILSSMAGGMTRTFAWPLLVMFLYFLIRRKEIKGGIVLVLQCLFYPVVFLISFFTYALSFLKWPSKVLFLDTSKRRWIIIIVSALLCATILLTKYVMPHDPEIGSLYSMSQLEADPESHVFGRIGVILPRPSFIAQAKKYIFPGASIPDMLLRILPSAKAAGTRELFGFGVLILMTGFLIYEVYRKRLKFPAELVYLPVASLILFYIARMVMFKIYLPVRYVRYSLSILVIILSGTVIAQLINKIRMPRLRLALQITAVLLIPASVLPINRNDYLMNASDDKDWLEYLGTLPKDALIAAPPLLADNIPTFAKRSVLINYEMSMPFYDRVWPTIKQRTFDFFNAYYADDPLSLYAFTQKYGIDDIVVDERLFSPRYLRYGRFYFEPFNYFVRKLVRQRKVFILAHIPDEYKLFQSGPIFIISTRDLLRFFKDMAKSSR